MTLSRMTKVMRRIKSHVHILHPQPPQSTHGHCPTLSLMRLMMVMCGRVEDALSTTQTSLHSARRAVTHELLHEGRRDEGRRDEERRRDPSKRSRSSSFR